MSDVFIYIYIYIYACKLEDKVIQCTLVPAKHFKLGFGNHEKSLNAEKYKKDTKISEAY